MTNGQRIFYKMMHVVTFIAIIGASLGMLVLAGIWIWKPSVGSENVSYGLELGVLSFDFPQEFVGDGFIFSNLFFISLMVLLLLYILLLINVKKFFKNLVHQRLFVASNANAIRNVGWVIITLSIFNNIPAVIAVLDVSKHVDFSNVPYTINYEFEMGLLFAGLAILAVGQIFKQAVKIAEENELTI